MEISLVERKLLIEEICNIFALQENQLKTYDYGKDFKVSFHYKMITIYVSNIEQRLNKYDKYEFDIYLENPILSDANKQIYGDSSPFWYMYAYFCHKQYDMIYDRDRAIEYLQTLKQLIDEDKLIFTQTDVKNQRRFVYIGKKKKEIVFYIDSKEIENVFGGDAKIMRENWPLHID